MSSSENSCAPSLANGNSSAFWLQRAKESAASQHGRADPMDRNTGEGLENVSVSVGDLATPIVCHMVVWAAERCRPLAPCHLWQVGGRVDPEVIKS